MILNKLTIFGIDKDAARKFIKANKHNHITTTYYLLLQKSLRRGVNSNSDISSFLFSPTKQDIPTKYPSVIEKSKEYQSR